MSGSHTGPLATAPLACPICSEALTLFDSVLRCETGHAFDVAREGYANLLPAQHRLKGIDGDSAEMLAARRRFLDTGAYGPLAELLGDLVVDRLRERDGSQPACVVDAGCGEGYYLAAIAARAAAARGAAASADPARDPAPLTFVGMDIAKPAVRMAARRYRDIAFVVGDINRRIGVLSRSASVLLDVFSPRNTTEFARVLEPGGIALVAIPGPGHLASLRDLLGLLDLEPDKEARVGERMAAERFEPAGRTELRYEMSLTATDVADLVTMSPSHRHNPDLSALDGDAPTTSTEAHFVVLSFRRIEADTR